MFYTKVLFTRSFAFLCQQVIFRIPLSFWVQIEYISLFLGVVKPKFALGITGRQIPFADRMTG